MRGWGGGAGTIKTPSKYWHITFWPCFDILSKHHHCTKTPSPCQNTIEPPSLHQNAIKPSSPWQNIVKARSLCQNTSLSKHHHRQNLSLCTLGVLISLRQAACFAVLQAQTFCPKPFQPWGEAHFSPKSDEKCAYVARLMWRFWQAWDNTVTVKATSQHYSPDFFTALFLCQVFLLVCLLLFWELRSCMEPHHVSL